MKLDVPTAVIAVVTATRRQVANQQVYKASNPRFLARPFQPNTLVALTYPGGSTGRQVAAHYVGPNNAILQRPPAASQRKTFAAGRAKIGPLAHDAHRSPSGMASLAR